MIDKSLKSDYILLNSNTPYLKSLARFSGDNLYRMFVNKQEYSEYLDNLISKVPMKLQKFAKLFKSFIIENIILVSERNSLLYGYTDNFVVCFINENSGFQEQLKQILGGMIVFSIIHNYKSQQMIRFITIAVNIYTRLLLTTTTRPVDFNELYPEIGRILSAWFLKRYNKLSLKNLNVVLSNNDISFVSSQDTQELFDIISRISRIDQLMNLLAEKLKTSRAQIITMFTTKYTLDFLLGFENLIQFLYMITISYIFVFPDNLYYKLKQINDSRLQPLIKVVSNSLNKYKSK